MFLKQNVPPIALHCVSRLLLVPPCRHCATGSVSRGSQQRRGLLSVMRLVFHTMLHSKQHQTFMRVLCKPSEGPLSVAWLGI